MPVDPRVDCRAEVLTAELVVAEDLSACVVVGVDLEVLGSLAVANERSLCLPSTQYRTVCGLRGFLPLMITDMAGLPDFCLT